MIDFGPFVEYYQNVKGSSPDTIRAYRSDLQLFSEFLRLQTIERVPQIDHAVIARYITHMRESVCGRKGRKGLADSTIARRLAAVSAFFVYTQATTHPKLRNPVADFSTRWKKNNRPKPVERKDIDTLLAAVDSPRDRIIFNLFLATGLRLSELVRLDRTSIIVEQQNYKEEKSHPKPAKVVTLGVGEVVGKGGKRRTFYVHLNTMLELASYLKSRSDDNPAMFLSERRQRISERTIQERMSYWCQKAGLESINIHRLRHTFATSLANAEMDVFQLKELMGHSSIGTTMQYTKIADTTIARGYHAAMEWNQS